MLQRRIITAVFFTILLIVITEGTQAQTDLPPGARVRLGTLDFLAGSTMSKMAFSQDCKSIVWQGADYTVRHWDLATAKEFNRFIGDDWGDGPQSYSIFQMIDNNSLLHTSANGLALLDLRTGKELVVTELARGKPSWISPDGKRVLTYSRRGSWKKRTAEATFTLWALERSEKLCEFTHEFKDAPAKASAGAQLTDVAFSPDGKSFVTSWVYVAHGPMITYRVGQLVSLWDVASREERSLDVEAHPLICIFSMGARPLHAPMAEVPVGHVQPPTSIMARWKSGIWPLARKNTSSRVPSIGAGLSPSRLMGSSSPVAEAMRKMPLLFGAPPPGSK